MEPVSPGTSSAARIAAVSGLVFAVLFVAALVFVHRAPTLGDPDTTYAAFYADGGDQLFVAVGLYLVPFAGIAFLWHMTAMRDVLNTLTPTPSAMAHGLNLLAGILFVTLLFAGTAAVGATAFGVYFGHAPVEDPATARALTAVGYGLVFVFAVRGAGMFALTTTTLLRTAGVLPKHPGRRRLPARRLPAARRDQQPDRRARLPGLGRAGLGLPPAPRPPRRGTLPRIAPRPDSRHHRPEPQERPVMTATVTPASTTVDDIPGPKGVPLLGNVFEIKQATLIQDLMRLAREWGPIFRLNSPNGPRYIVSGLEMVDDLCDDTRFDKLVGLSQRELRKTHESAGLFTADTDDPLWKSAHDILLPSFSTWAMKGYVDPMIDIAEQLCLKWERLNPDEPIDVTADMTRLTLDTIALCGFSYRFNSFYRDTEHPFVAAMMSALHETQARQRLLPVAIKLRRGAQRRLLADAKLMDDTVGTILAERKASGEPGTDLLGHMLVGTDKQGNRLPDHNIVAQCETFLVAGHETTSGLLSFVIAYLLKNPEVVARAQAEVDRVLGTDPSVPPTVAQIGQLGYIRQILDETLRLWPTAPAFTRQARQETTVGGWGPFAPGQSIIALTPMLHRLPAIWGPDADDFNPDHFDPQRRDALPPNAYKPFGSGQRACIGRQFALQEATLVLGMLLQRFEFVDHANYQLKIKESLTLKPDGLTITGPPPLAGGPGARRRGRSRPPRQPRSPSLAVAPADRHGTPLLVLFGSNLGRLRISPRGSRGTRPTGATRPAPPRSTRPSGSCRPRAPSWSSPRPTTGSHRTTPGSSARGPTTSASSADRGALHGLRLRQPRLGRDLPGRTDPDRRRVGGARRDPGVPARRRRRARRLRRPVRGLVRRAVGRPGVRLGLDESTTAAAGAARGSPWRSSSAARRARSCSPTAARPRPCGSTASSPPARAPRAGARCGTWRSRCPPARPTPRATTSVCCRATPCRW